jgi:zinc protease
MVCTVRCLPCSVEGPFNISLSTRNDQTQEALALIRTNLQNFLRDGVTDTQVQEAKDNILGSFPLSTASNAAFWLI